MKGLLTIRNIYQLLQIVPYYDLKRELSNHKHFLNKREIM